MVFAEDMIILSDTIIGLQNQLNILAKTSAELDLHVNPGKFNIVIFRMAVTFQEQKNRIMMVKS